MTIPFIEENDQTRARHEHLDALRELVGNAYPNKFERSQIVEQGHEDTISDVVEKFRAFEPKAPEGQRPPAEAIELANQQLSDKSVRVAGRIAGAQGDVADEERRARAAREGVLARLVEPEGLRPHPPSGCAGGS